MTSSPPGPLIDAIASGDDIDWDGASSRYAKDARLLQGLRAIDAIARGTRPDVISKRRQKPKTVAVWGAALLGLLAAGQTVAALVGYFALRQTGDSPISPAAAIAAVLMFAGTAAWLIIGSDSDPRSTSLGIFFLLVASAFSRRFLPHALVTSAAFSGAYPDAFLAAPLWRFAGNFPRAIKFGRLDALCRLAWKVSVVIGVLLFGANVLLAHGIKAVPSILHRSDQSGLYWLCLLGLLVPPVPIMAIRARRAPPSEKRRLLVFSLGLALVVPVVIEILAEAASPALNAFLSRPHIRPVVSAIFFGLLLAIPPVTAYAVLVDRVLDVRVTIGRLLRVLLARPTTYAVTVLLLGSVAAYGYLDRDQSVVVLLSGIRGLLVVIAVLMACALVMGRGPALAAIDRSLLGRSGNLAGELAAITTQMTGARSVIEIAQFAEEGLCRTLGVDRAVVLLPNEKGDYDPARGSTRPLMCAGALGALLAIDRAPLLFDTRGRRSLESLLPAAEREWIHLTGTRAVLPLIGNDGRPLGLIAVGCKRSQDVFSSEELALALAVASGTALAIGPLRRQAGSISSADEPAAECLKCGSVIASHAAACRCGSATRPAALPPMLAGKFEVTTYIGAGGMGVVYRAEDVTLGRSVALKTFLKISPDVSDRMSREARMMATVAHPNLASIYGIEHWRGTPILVIEFLEGGSLAQKLKQRQPIGEVLRLGALLAPALEQLHHSGILHRDLKPSNIGFSREGVPKMLDFGLASFVSNSQGARVDVSRPAAAGMSVTQSLMNGDVMVQGTPLYLSPEVAGGDAPQAGLDLWALALVLYEAIAGRHPFAAATVEGVLRQVRRAEVPDLRKARPDCNPEVARAFMRLLAKDPSQRPQTATDLRKALEDLCQSVTTTAYETGSPRVY